MRYAIIENGVVRNVVLASEELAAERGWIRTDEAGPGWTWDGAKFAAPPPPPQPPPPPPDPNVADLDVKVAAVPAGPIREAFQALRKVIRR